MRRFSDPAHDHRIDYDTLYSHVLRKIRECARAALMDGEAVADRLTNTCEAEQREQREAMERSLARDEERIEVLDKLVMRLYEDMVAGRISEQNFNTMLEKTQTEQTELKTRVSDVYKRQFVDLPSGDTLRCKLFPADK